MGFDPVPVLFSKAKNRRCDCQSENNILTRLRSGPVCVHKMILFRTQLKWYFQRQKIGDVIVKAKTTFYQDSKAVHILIQNVIVFGFQKGAVFESI